MIGYILLFTFLASILSLFLAALLLLWKGFIKMFSFHLVSFAAGALLSLGFLEIMPEAVERNESAFLFVTIFICVFFLIERLFLDLHHHEREHEGNLRVPVQFLLFGDALHNFIDGLSIASMFLVSFPAGLVTSCAVFIHEIPHELGDFGILISLGYDRVKVLFFNALTGFAAILGAIIGFYLAGKIEGILPLLLSVTAANFIYLSLTDLLPELYGKRKQRYAFLHTSFFLAGVLVIFVLVRLLEG